MKCNHRPQTHTPIFRFLLFLTIVVVVLTWNGCSSLPDSGRIGSATLSAPLQLHIVDVGYGESLIFVSPNRRAVIWDGGYKKAYPHLSEYIKTLGIKEFDCMFSTHPHPDHIEGLIEVLRDFPVKEVRGAFPIIHDDVPVEFGELLQEKSIQYTIMRRGDVWIWEDAISFFCYNPDELGADMNDSSLVCQVRWKDHRILLTSDVGPLAQKELLLRYKQTLNSTFMTVPHHGGNASPEFFKAVDPRYLSLSVGDNPWGNPKQKTLDFLENNGYSITRTDEDGTIIYAFWPDGKVSQQMKVTVKLIE